MATLKERIVQIPQKLAEMLAGTSQQDEALPQNIVYSAEARETLDPANMQPTLQLGTKTTPAKNGFLQDFMSGAKENYNNAFTPENLQPQNKNWATRLGEGLGTALRFGDSSAGRGLMAGAAALALGMSPGQALGYGLGTTAGRQGILASDKLYRNQLKNMGMTENELKGIKGYIDNDMFKNYTLANYRNNMINYRNLKLDKDTYIKQQQNIYKMLNDGVITAEEATRQMQLLNDEYQKQNPMDMQESNKTVQGNRRLDIMEKNADTYAKKADKVKVEDTEEYKQDYTDYIRIMTDPKLAKYRSQAQVDFAAKYGKNPKVN